MKIKKNVGIVPTGKGTENNTFLVNGENLVGIVPTGKGTENNTFLVNGGK